MPLKILSLLFFIVSLSLSNAQAFFFSSNVSNPRIAHIVIDYNSGRVLSEHNSQEIRRPASLTKMMTLYLLFDKISNGEISFDTKFKISQAAANQVPSKLGLPAGSYITVQDAILAVIIKSNNDIAYAIAENLAGTVDNFVDQMNAKAQELGLYHTHFTTPNGLNDPNQYTTAEDMARLARALMINHNAYYPLFSVTNFKWNKRNYTSTNHLLDYEGVDGIKTGYTNASGFNLVTSAAKNNTRIIAVAIGFNTSSGRDEYMKNIIDEGFLLAVNNRVESIKYKTKPDFITDDNLTIDHKYISYDEKDVTQEEDTSSNAKLIQVDYNSNSFSEQPYVIEKVPYLLKLVSKDEISINPLVKRSVANKANSTGKYSIQIGAFSNYKSALTASYNAVSMNSIKSFANKKNVEIIQKSNLYMARVGKLSKKNAYKVCNVLQNKGSDCFVIG